MRFWISLSRRSTNSSRTVKGCGVVLGFRSFLLPCLVLLAGCILKPRDIPGNVFITDEKGQAQKLALVPISIYAEAEMKKAVEKTEAVFGQTLNDAKKKLVALGGEYERLSKERQKQDEELKALDEKIQQLEKTRPANPKYYRTPNTDILTTTTKVNEPFTINPSPAKKSATEEREEREKREQEVYELMARKWREEFDTIKGERDAVLGELQAKEANLADLENQQSIINQFLGVQWQGAFWGILSQNLPPPAVETKTDADGNFLIPSPPRGRLAISARYDRTEGDKTESLYWLLYLPQPLPPDGRVLLNNENLLSASPTNAVFRFQGR